MAKDRRKSADAEGQPAPARWTNRITGQGEVPPDQLLANPQNWRVHPMFQQKALVAALDEVGWLQPVMVNTVTGHVVDGHLRVMLAISEGQTAVPVLYVELTEEEERKALLTLDPITRLAVGDPTQVHGLLEGVSTENEALRKLFDNLAVENPLRAGEAGSAPIFDARSLEGVVESEHAGLGESFIVYVTFPDREGFLRGMAMLAGEHRARSLPEKARVAVVEGVALLERLPGGLSDDGDGTSDDE